MLLLHQISNLVLYWKSLTTVAKHFFFILKYKIEKYSQLVENFYKVSIVEMSRFLERILIQKEL